MKKTNVIPLPNIIPLLFDPNSKEYDLFEKSIAVGIVFNVTANFLYNIDDFLKKEIASKKYTPEQAAEIKSQLLGKLKYIKTGFESFINKSRDMGFRSALKDQVALHYHFENGVLWGPEIPPECKNYLNRLKIITTIEYQEKILDSFRVYAESISEKTQQEEVIEIDSAFIDVKPESKPGFYPGFVRYIVEKKGFQRADNPEIVVKLSDLPDPLTLDRIRFIDIFDVREKNQIAFMEILDYAPPHNTIPYWGLIISLEKEQYDSDVFEHTFFKNTINENEYPVKNGYFIFGPKGDDFKEDDTEWVDFTILKEQYGILLKQVKAKDLGYSFIQLFYKDDAGNPGSITLDLNPLLNECLLDEWSKRIENFRDETS